MYAVLLSSKDGESHIMASGFYVGDSHYVVVIQSMSGKVDRVKVLRTWTNQSFNFGN